MKNLMVSTVAISLRSACGEPMRWSQRFPANSPTARTGAAMAYDLQRNCAVLAGGQSSVAEHQVVFGGPTCAFDDHDNDVDVR